MTTVDVTRLAAQILRASPNPQVDVTRLGVQVLASRTHELDGQSDGAAQTAPDLEGFEPGLLTANSFGGSQVTGALTGFMSSVGRGHAPLATLDVGVSELRADVLGEGQVLGFIDRAIRVPYKPIPYPLAYGVAGVAELSAVLLGLSEVVGQAEAPPQVDINGDSHTDANLTQAGLLDETSTIFGDAVAEGELFVDGALDLDGQSLGDAECYVLGPIASDNEDAFFANDIFTYYIYGTVNTGFNPTDHVDGTDGDIIRDFARYKYLYVNVNVGFDYTDDASSLPGFVSQSYPDGDIIRDFARYMYQYLLVIPEIEPPFHRLTIGPAPRKPRDLTPTPRPPRKKNR
jgi:hypothetical protein